MERFMNTQFDDFERRCPILGHQIRFQYCRSSNQGHPCRKVLDCWFERFPVQHYFQDILSEEDFNNLGSPAKHKWLSLLDLIDQAKSARS